MPAARLEQSVEARFALVPAVGPGEQLSLITRETGSDLGLGSPPSAIPERTGSFVFLGLLWY